MKKKDQDLGVGAGIAGECKFCKKKISGKGKYCSHKCYGLDKKGKHHNWGNKISKSLRGVPKSKTHIENARQALIGRKRPELTGEKHFAWKGNKALYGTIHDWVYRHFGRPKKCSICGIKKKNKMYHWANISGQYKRERIDWMEVCVRCHKLNDLKNKHARTIRHLKKPKQQTDRG